MKDNRNEMIPEQLAGWVWDLTGYAAKVPFYNADDLTMREVRSVFQLDPEPPQMELNGVIYRFLTRNGNDRYDPARFLDYKLEVLQMLLYCLPRFDPEQETKFLKYAKHYIRDGLLFCRMMGEAGSFASLAEYRRVRQIGAMYNNSGKSRAEAFDQLSYKEQWYLEKRNAICMTCGRVSPLSTQSTFEDLAVDFEGTTASGAERFYRRTLDKLRLKLLESRLVHTVTLKQTECRKRNKKLAATVYPGIHLPFSHFEMVLLDTPSFSASCSCVRFFSLRFFVM